MARDPDKFNAMREKLIKVKHTNNIYGYLVESTK